MKRVDRGFSYLVFKLQFSARKCEKNIISNKHENTVTELIESSLWSQ